MFELTVKTHFDAAHQLRNYSGKCASIHGHTWRVEVIVEGQSLDHVGMLIDFSLLKKMIKEEIARFDHSFINELEGFNEKGVNPTAENLAAYIYTELVKKLSGINEQIRLQKIKVWESDNACAAYMEG